MVKLERTGMGIVSAVRASPVGFDAIDNASDNFRGNNSAGHNAIQSTRLAGRLSNMCSIVRGGGG